MKRPYNKTSPYWTQKTAGATQHAAVASTIPNINYETSGENLMAIASCGGGASRESRGPIQNSQGPDPSRFQNLKQGILPYQMTGGYMSIQEAIILTQLAYANVAIFRNAIELMVEFSNTNVYLKGGNAKSREFIKAWFSKIGLYQFNDEWFREYYRSGNVFAYRFDGKLRDEDFEKVKQVMGAKSNTIPVRYIILNPSNVFVTTGVTNNWTYVKMMSTYEIMRLKNPQTPEDKATLQDLPAEVQKQIKSFTGGVGMAGQIYVPVNPKRLNFCFYKKQSYEPLAIPMGYPVLNDIEWKLQLKKMDMALSRTIEHAILLVTTGAEPDKGGINQNNLASLQKLFKNPTLGRVLVADYTTKAQWLIPDFKELLGPQKYEVVDRDIREGLQTMLVGEDKFANAVLKAKVFMERLLEGQKAFLNNFLQKEIDRVCAEMGFKATPKAYFEKNMMQNEIEIQKLYVRLAELGMLTPDQTFKAIETNVLPDESDMDEAQKKFKDKKDDGLFVPLIGGGQVKEEGRPKGTKAPQSTKKVKPIGTGSVKFSAKACASNLATLETIKQEVKKACSSKWSVAEFSSEQNEVVEALARRVFVNEQDWLGAIPSYLDAPKAVPSEVSAMIDDIRAEHDVDENMAVVLLKAIIE